MKDAKGTWIPRKVKSGDEFVLIFGHRKQKAKLKSLAVGENTYHDQDSYICLGELAFTLLPDHDKLLRLSSQHAKKISFCLKIWRPTKSSIMWAVHVNTAARKLEELHEGRINDLWAWGLLEDEEGGYFQVLKESALLSALMCVGFAPSQFACFGRVCSRFP